MEKSLRTWKNDGQIMGNLGEMMEEIEEIMIFNCEDYK